MNKLNKTLIAILLVLCVGLVGITIAYFSNSTEIENEFITKEYGTTYTEEFVSPSNWLPGDTTDKTITVTNSGEVDEAVRISLFETWTPNDSNATLTGWIHADGTKSNHTTEEELATDVRAALINFTENSDWTKVGDYYYYNYKLAPGETTDSLIESVTFNALTKLGDTCTPSTSNGTTTITCNSSGDDYDHATYKLTINIETVQYNKYQEAWGTNVAIAEEKLQLETFAQHIIRNSNSINVTNYNSGVITEAYTFYHDATDQTPAQTDYRYIGDSPNNFVYFNCDDLNNQSSETCEIWRVIGVFDVQNNTGSYNQMVKLVRGYNLSENSMWDNRDGDWSGSGINYWYGSVINLYLNGDYFDELSKSAKLMIGDAKYYLGGGKWITNHYGSTEEIYAWERGREVYNQNEIEYLDNWYGKVALMYPSDVYMTYANGVEPNCYSDPHLCKSFATPSGIPNKSWIYNTNIKNDEDSPYFTWVLSSRSDCSYCVFNIYSDGYLAYRNAYYSQSVRPVVYLKSTVKILSGTGESTNPYKLAY